MTEPDFLNTKLYAIDHSGNELDIDIHIGKPQPHDMDYATTINIKQLDVKNIKLMGVDPIQSILVAISIVKTHLKLFEKRGGKLYLGQERTPDSQFIVDVWCMADNGLEGISGELKKLLSDMK